MTPQELKLKKRVLESRLAAQGLLSVPLNATPIQPPVPSPDLPNRAPIETCQYSAPRDDSFTVQPDDSQTFPPASSAWEPGPPPSFDDYAPPTEDQPRPQKEIDTGKAPVTATSPPVLLDLVALAACDPAPPQFIVEGMLPEGEVALLAGHGGSGKSIFALILAICLALGIPIFGIACTRRRVAFMSYEDKAEVLHWRITRICRMLGVEMSTLAGWLFLFDGTQADAVWFADDRFGAGTKPAFVDVKSRVSEVGAQVLIVDGVSDTFAGNENNRAQVKAYCRAIRAIVPADGAVLVIGHVDKTSAGKPQDAQGYSGSSGWHNGVRARWYMYPPDEQDDSRMVVEVKKSNHGASGLQIPVRFSRDLGTLTYDGDIPRTSLQQGLQEVDERDAILRIVRDAEAAGDPIPAASGGQRTAHSVAEGRKELPVSLRGKTGRKRFNRHIESLRADGRLKLGAHVRANRHRTEVLHVAE